MAGDADARGRTLMGFIAVGLFLTRFARAAPIRRRILEVAALCLCVSLPLTAFGAVGRTAGGFDVSPTGTANYTIPLTLPAGTNGLTPSLSLRYSHGQGNGLLGMGWSIRGLSGISRCNKTIAQDGAASAATLAVSDGYCLDGNRLRLTGGTYGTANSTYQTEFETFTRVTAQGVAGNGPASWEARGKDGLIYEYGNTVNSRIETVGSTTTRLWALNKIRDRAGNYIEFVYFEDTTNGSFRPDEIRYGGNSGQGTAHAYTIKFEHETVQRPDTIAGYFAGNETVSGQIIEIRRLDRVDVEYNSALVRRYDLSYEPSGGAGGRSRLSSVQECDGALDCLASTMFAWQNGTAGLSSSSNTGQAVSSPYVVDINADGRDDVIWIASGTLRYMLASTSGGYATAVNTGFAVNTTGPLLPLEWDGDGRMDLLNPKQGNTWWVYRANGTGFDAPLNTAAPYNGVSNAYLVADVDGDGRDDLVRADRPTGSPHSLKVRLRSGSAFAASEITAWTAPQVPYVYELDSNFPLFNPILYRTGPVKRPDFDGDGRGDLIAKLVRKPDPEIGGVDQKQHRIFFSSGPVNAPTLVSGGGTPLSSTTSFEPIVCDLNGDGLLDIIYQLGTTSWKMLFNRGRGVGTEVFGPSNSGFYAQTAARVLDWDGDGMDDLLMPKISPANWFVARSTGQGLLAPVDTGIPVGSVGYAHVVDLNGDRLYELATINTSAANVLEYRVHQGIYPDLLDRATDGFGMYVDFNYASLTAGGSTYTKGSGATFPTIDYQGPLYVVSSYTATNGIGGSFTMTFNYEQARKHLQGRGFLGFGKRKVTDSRNNIRSEETYLQNPAEYQTIGLPSLVQVKQSSGTLIQEATPTWSKLTYSSGFTERRLPFISQQVIKRYEAGGAYNGSLINTATTTNLVNSTSGTIYDSTTATVEAGTANGVQAGASYSERIYHPTADLLNDTSSTWCIGRPGETQLINSHTEYGGGSITRTVNRTWDTLQCRVTQEIVEPDSTQWKVTRDLGYDGWGNVNSEAITGIGMAVRTTTANWGSTGRFLASVTNPLSQATQFGWDAAIGTLTSQTDPNGLVTSWQYDGFGRKTQENRPDGTDTTVSYNDCSSVSGGCVNSNNKMVVIATQRDTADGFVTDQWSYLDKFNRPIVTKSLMLSGSYNRVDREYDALGRISRESAPCWAVGCTLYWTTFTYDLLNRATQVARPTSDSDPTLATTTTYFEGLTTRSVDALSKQSTKIANVLGSLARSIDHDGYYQGFDYDGFGHAVRVTDSLSNTLQSVTYNVRGMKTAQTDMDMGSWSFTPNALGEVVSQTDAKSQNATFVYDKLSRLTSRTEPEGTSTWTWGTSAAAKNIGRLASLSGPGYSESYVYDSIGRPQTTTITSDASYQVAYAYSALGLLHTLTYPTSTSSYRLKLQYDYQSGHLLRVKDFNAPTTVFWEANASDPRGNVIDEDLGNGLQTIRGFDLVTGLVDSIVTGLGGSGSIQNLSYLWDKVGNLTQRQDVRQSLTEVFTYDHLHRLDLSTLNGLTNLDLSYNALGNISSKSDVGSYTYHATKKHAVTAAGSSTFAYDANGNVSTRNGSTISWYSYNLPNTINASGSNSSQFFYAPDRARWKQVASYGGTAETTITIGGLIEKVTLGSVTSWKHTIAGGSGPVAVYTRKSDSTNQIHYLTKDHLGSVDSVTNGSGAIEVRLSFASFGARRKEAGWSGNPTSGDWNQITATTRRGFTFHEMLDNLNLTHMNGRIYDQVVGRFLSADPYIQAPGFTQAFNRYSYVWNNPLSFTDPSGFSGDERLLLVCIDGRCGSFRGSLGDLLGALQPDLSRESRTPGGGGGNEPGPNPPPQDPPETAPRPTTTVPVTSCPGDFMPCGQFSFQDSTVDGAMRPTISESLEATRAHIRELEESLRQSGEMFARHASQHRTQSEILKAGAANALDALLTGVNYASMVTPAGMARGVLRGQAARGVGSLDDLSRAAGAADRNGLTRAGRALQKHGDRPGSAFPQVRGHENLNRAGQNVVDDILTTPGATRASNRFGGIDVVAPGGRGVRYDANGNFMGFLEPRP